MAVPAHPRVPDHQVLDRGPLGVAEVERARDVRWRLDDHERRERGIGGRARAVGREDVRGQPALVDRAFDLVRRIGLRELPHRAPLGNRTARSSSGRTGRGTTCWFGVRGRPVIPAAVSGALSARYRASPVAARERPSRRLYPRGSHHPALAPGRPVATLPGHRREARSLARGPGRHGWHPGTRRSRCDVASPVGHRSSDRWSGGLRNSQTCHFVPRLGGRPQIGGLHGQVHRYPRGILRRDRAAARRGARQWDLDVEAQEGVHYEHAWLDPESGKVFCLVTGPSKEAVMRVHEKGGPPDPGSLRSPDRGLLTPFPAGRSAPIAAGRRRSRRVGAAPRSCGADR